MPDLGAPQHPLPVGARVHHRGEIWSLMNDGGSSGWGTVLQVKPQHDKTFEYEVKRDKPFLGNETTWWASYHVDRASRGGATSC